jgi:phenylacetate-coenzyme A ligase PaaK-like adenylate-forming protein
LNTPVDPDLAALLARICEAPPLFYQRALSGIAPSGSIANGLEALRRLPLTRRDDLVRDQLDHLPHGTRRLPGAPPPVRAGITGSGESLLVLSWSPDDLQRERAAGARMLRRLGVAPGMRVANALPGGLTTPGALLLGDVIEDIGALDVPLGAIDNESAARAAWDLIDRVQPGILVLERASAARLLAAAPAARRPWWVGTIWLCRGAAPGDQRPFAQAVGFEGWQRAWLSVPEASSFAAYACDLSRFHIGGRLVAEIVDSNTGGPPAAEGGILTLTVLDSDAPLLRYATGVGARLEPAGCACGEPAAAIALL